MIIPQLQSISVICNGPESVTGIRLTSKCVTQGYFLLSHTNRPPPPPCAIKQQSPLRDDSPETSQQHPSFLARLSFLFRRTTVRLRLAAVMTSLFGEVTSIAATSQILWVGVEALNELQYNCLTVWWFQTLINVEFPEPGKLVWP